MSIRDDLAQTIFEAMDWVDPTDDIEQAGADAEHLADAALDWLGQLDPDADPELIALHLRDSRAELERLRALPRRIYEWLIETNPDMDEDHFVEASTLVDVFEAGGPEVWEAQLEAALSALKKEEGDR